MLTPIKREYISLAGVDFTNDPSKIQLNRSPYCVNMYKDYSSTLGQCVETRPGVKNIAKIGNKNNSIYIFDIQNEIQAIVHSCTKLYKWSNYPNYPNLDNLKELHTDMKDFKSSYFIFDSKLYINDGKNYLVYDGENIKNVKEDAFIPTTTTSRNPIGGGEVFQPINLLTSYRKNRFVADGKSVDYFLDAINIDNKDISVEVDGIKIEDCTINRILGKVTFKVAPTAPATEGQDNVIITFSKTNSKYVTRISDCTLSLFFDNRVFFSGNSNYKNAVFHSQLNDPTYISDLNYYQDGEDTSAIKSMTIGNNLLWVFKESNQQNATIFYHVPTLDSEYGKVYPSKQGNISTGCYSTCCNFNDDIVFMSKYGLEGINGEIDTEQVLSHRSSLVDNKLINENDFNKLNMCEWNGYLLCLIGNHIYLADSRQKYQGINGYEYEWYYWELLANDTVFSTIKEYKGTLLLGDTQGNIYALDGSNDNGLPIYSCWTMPSDTFGYENHLKTANKRGGVAKMKMIPNSKFKVSIETDKKNEKLIKEYSASGLDFNNIDFNNFSFSAKDNSYIVYKIKAKKFIILKIKFYSDEINRPFGLYSATVEAFGGGYMKR